MSAVTFNPFSLKECTLSIDSSTYETGVGQVEFVPSVSASSFTSIAGGVRRGQGKAEWACTITFLQDLTSGSLSRMLLENEGETVTAVFAPVSGGASISADIILSPGTMGGTAASNGELAKATVTLAVDGAPSFIDPATTTTTTTGA